MTLYERLLTCCKSDLCLPYPREVCHAKAVSVYDGDTFTAAVAVNGRLEEWHIRMLGYDSPEIRSKNQAEKAEAVRCKEALSRWVLNKVFLIRPTKPDKYGRLLCDVFVSKKMSDSCPASLVDTADSRLLWLNDWMIKNTKSLPYDGGTKTSFEL